jgi:hypothetical protein
MVPFTRRQLQWLGLIVVGLAVTAGCNPLSTIAYFVSLSGDPKVEAQCHLTREDKKPSKVVILVSTGAVETREQLIGADRELSGLVATKLQEGCKGNKENVNVVPASRVQRYKDEHPNWQALGGQAVGKYFRADYVVDMEIASMTLYEKRSANQMYRGNAEISVAVHDMHKPEDEQIFTTVYTCQFPESRPVPVTDSTYQKFRLMFLTHVANELSWYFTAHDVSDHVPVD